MLSIIPVLIRTAYGSRTRHSSVKGRCINRFTNAAFRVWDGKGSKLLIHSKFIFEILVQVIN
jgi:hypothetical protein